MPARFIVPLFCHVRETRKVPLIFWIILVRSMTFIEAGCKLFILAAMSDQPLTLFAYTETSTARPSAEFLPPLTTERLIWSDSILSRKSVPSLNAVPSGYSMRDFSRVYTLRKVLKASAQLPSKSLPQYQLISRIAFNHGASRISNSLIVIA
jgi:hypothetical protein